LFNNQCLAFGLENGTGDALVNPCKKANKFFFHPDSTNRKTGPFNDNSPWKPQRLRLLSFYPD
jgi:hypothetical protein